MTRGFDVCASLREHGFLLAIDKVLAPSLDRRLIADLRPDFVFLDPSVPPRLQENEVAKAHLAAAVVFVARLGGRIVARGIDSKATAAVVADLGVQYGVGPHLAHPLVVDPALAEPTDEVVPVAWFQRREVRVFRERGDTLSAPIEMTPVTLAGPACWTIALSPVPRGCGPHAAGGARPGPNSRDRGGLHRRD